MPPSSGVPKAAWTRRLDDVPENPGRPRRYSFDEILSLLPTIIRLYRWERQTRKAGREPFMEPFKSLDPGPVQGVPLGGIGGGTITRGWRGDFTRWQMLPGRYDYRSVPIDLFSVYIRRAGEQPRVSALYPGEAPGAPPGWAWGLSGNRSTYYALYPRAWTVYEEPDPHLRLVCRQVSPVIPHNYRESSTPAGVFVWTIENTGTEAATVGLMFTFQNGTGGENDRAGGHCNRLFQLDGVTGITLHHACRVSKPPEQGQAGQESEELSDPLTFVIAARATPGVTVSYRARFVSTSSCMDVWSDFRDDGKLQNLEDDRPSGKGVAIGAAIAATVEVPAGETREVAFALAWDMPLARFGSGSAWYRRYTRFYGEAGNAAPAIARDALHNYPAWEEQIEAWQKPILDDPDLPNWYKAALFNELYYIADGGTIWTDRPEFAPPPDKTAPLAAPDDDKNIGHFAYLEGHEYRMYNTYDVHFYASFALAMLWPELELSIQRDFARALMVHAPEERRLTGSGKIAPRKVRGMIPHDLGGPDEDPWNRINIYNLQDVSRWKDLNPKFVLQVYRDYIATGDRDFLTKMWDAVRTAIQSMWQFDRDGDSLIENEGFPDQTYDAWTAKGASAYSGGLWLACLSAAAAMAQELGDKERAEEYRTRLSKAQAAYEELLWNGDYYDYDSSGGPHSASIMADQLAGQWYARACGLPPIVPEENIRKALKTIYEFNVGLFQGGEMGAVNGIRPDGRIDSSSTQAQEVWTGTTYALAAAMIQEGLVEEGFATARGVANTTYERGYWFQTPEAWDYLGNFRSLAYMRPLVIWAMQWAWQRCKQDKRSE